MNTVTKLIVDATYDIENKETPFGKRWDGEVFTLTKEDIEKLKEGKLLALDVMAEYITYIKLKG